ncbi:TIGR03668 family PPOX class F420-dependent oxidoreductase [Streptomyces lunaelactis]|uniref:TIGR03668 family PPOX class F420-dependent oxidoreductase n=1 Tax=Streptomyces lunaelactis TaxID=1535768 RepID=UPI00158505D2|nr:TIGR03668 family PPOX class F420-dependent oxidoreductase [Streptomyces lunaelactis]NUK25304.1 TIGR03668 family PPOX class F420-dependent oxidoreductase [Streptomyces lunaelactis]NUK37982.1 TIGR03668 family PPOX class F420-dependent oxidoreductase [Streptomyces lunaelactis]NUK44885.1 TIGR03668 family PPOX class F420-dependent oxidoreductase [Streptomyces lunaelactis]NUK52179.1 TIGR03668 family PPOX class F420-dependent oxidoreductase [Streptomyces lunaelactis]NUK58995.1 TIGR03668 family PPO
MRLGTDDARQRFEAASVAHLATVSGSGVPHLVPLTFAVDGDLLCFAIDHKPKSTWNLRRLRNISENARVAALVDHYDDDWTQLWWARADGQATVIESGERRSQLIELLRTKYVQYRQHPPEGPVVVIRVSQWSGWSFG